MFLVAPYKMLPSKGNVTDGYGTLKKHIRPIPKLLHSINILGGPYQYQYQYQYFGSLLININTNINIWKVTLSISISISIVLITSISIVFQYQYWKSLKVLEGAGAIYCCYLVRPAGEHTTSDKAL